MKTAPSAPPTESPAAPFRPARRHWLRLAALLAWMAVIALLSGQIGSQEEMRRGLSWALRPFVSPALHPDPSDLLSPELVWVLRKFLHLTEYALLALLAGRWFLAWPRPPQTLPWGRSLLLCAAYAALDELHQAAVPGRTSSGWDVLIDVSGAASALTLWSASHETAPGLRFRVVDVLGAGLGLLLAWPLLLLAALLVRLTMGSPVLFRQVRVGRGERPFTLFKIRTMNEAREADGQLQAPGARLTPVGRWLRYLSLDELPQLWNVLKGDMSLVGPRPLYVEYLPYYRERERLRHRVRPGITGLAQVSGRNSLTWDERLELDAQYVERKSLALDLRIMLRTVAKVLRRSDVRDEALGGNLAEYRAALGHQPKTE